MKRIVIAICVVVLVFVVAIIAQTPAQPTSGSVEKELLKLEKGWADALVEHDLAFVDRILADDYMSTDSEGTVGNKAQEIATLKSGDYVLVSTVLDNIEVHVYGDAAVYFGRSTDKAQLKGKDISGQYQWTDTWINNGGRWQCVASHGSKISHEKQNKQVARDLFAAIDNGNFGRVKELTAVDFALYAPGLGEPWGSMNSFKASRNSIQSFQITLIRLKT